MKELIYIIIVISVCYAVLAIWNDEYKVNAYYHTELQRDSSNEYFCLLAKERGASEQYLFSNWCYE